MRAPQLLRWPASTVPGLQPPSPLPPLARHEGEEAEARGGQRHAAPLAACSCPRWRQPRIVWKSERHSGPWALRASPSAKLASLCHRLAVYSAGLASQSPGADAAPKGFFTHAMAPDRFGGSADTTEPLRTPLVAPKVSPHHGCWPSVGAPTQAPPEPCLVHIRTSRSSSFSMLDQLCHVADGVQRACSRLSQDARDRLDPPDRGAWTFPETIGWRACRRAWQAPTPGHSGDPSMQ